MQLASPGDQILEQLPDQLPARFIGEVAVRVEALLRLPIIPSGWLTGYMFRNTSICRK
jgi:hypothetical protein